MKTAMETLVRCPGQMLRTGRQLKTLIISNLQSGLDKVHISDCAGTEVLTVREREIATGTAGTAESYGAYTGHTTSSR